jgi:hypothetical protein
VADARAAGLRQASAAQALGLSPRTLQRWQQGRRPPCRAGNPRPWNALLPQEHALIAAVVARRDLADGSCRALAFWVLEHEGRARCVTQQHVADFAVLRTASSPEVEDG